MQLPDWHLFNLCRLGRFFVFMSFGALVLAKKAQPMLLKFGVIDALGAVWTLIALL